MRHLSLVALAALLAVGPLAAANVDPSTPESAVTIPATALKSNDFLSLFKALPAADQAKAKAEWDANRGNMSPSDKAEFNENLQRFLAPDAVDVIVAQAEPNLAELNPAEMAAGVQMFGGMMAMQMAQDPKTKEQGALLQQLVMDVSAWLPTSGIEQPAKLRQAVTHFVNGVKMLGIKNADEFAALELEELLARAGRSSAEMKKSLLVYGLNLDGLLGSIAITNLAGTGNARTGTLTFTAFGNPYKLPVDLKQKDGFWVFDTDKAAAALAPMTGGLMGPPGM